MQNSFKSRDTYVYSIQTEIMSVFNNTKNPYVGSLSK